jgi:hypothetical protein
LSASIKRIGRKSIDLPLEQTLTSLEVACYSSSSHT